MSRVRPLRSVWVPLLACAVVAVAGGWFARVFRGTGTDMSTAAVDFAQSLTEEQRAAALMPFEDPRRLEWHFIPKPERKGLQVKHMEPAQRKRALRLLESGLSQLGYSKATQVMALEGILRELEKARTDGPIRDPERYYFTIFGEPAGKEWGLSIEGHHLSLNWVVRDGVCVATTPTFYGANPAEVRNAGGTDFELGTRVLAPEEDLGFALLASLTDEQRQSAVISAEAPADVRSAGEAQPPDSAPEGLAAAEMTEAQQALLWELLGAYAANVPAEIGEARLDQVATGGIEKVYFAWAGAAEPGIGHYYRVQGPTFLIEFVNTQPDAEGNPANHIHAFWRDMAGDFGVPR